MEGLEVEGLMGGAFVGVSRRLFMYGVYRVEFERVGAELEGDNAREASLVSGGGVDGADTKG